MDNVGKRDTKESIARALNAHGFLLQQRVEEEIEAGVREEKHGWVLEASEYPVTASNGKETRLDVVLALARERGIKIGIECKRANPRYKMWLFWGEEPAVREGGHRRLYFEVGERNGKGGKGPNRWRHRFIQLPARDFPLCHFFIESDRNGEDDSRREDAANHAIEQATFGQSGLFQKVGAFQESDVFCAVPVVVTTAELYHVQFDVSDIGLTSGRIAPDRLEYRSVPYVAVNFAGRDRLSPTGESMPYGRTGVQQDMTRWQLHTYFVVQAPHINDFLAHFDHYLSECWKL
jgi:hypothetical protein